MSDGDAGTVHVLHVDDDESFLSVSAELLERAADRIRVETTTDPRAVLDRVRSDPPDCIVSEYRLSGLDGLELLARVREVDADVPFVLFTAAGSEAVASEAISAGVTDYIQKQTGTERYELLANRVCNAVRRTDAERRAAEQERVNAVVREVNRALVRATTRSEIETEICETLSRSEPYRFAYVGRYDPESDVVTPTAWAGVERGYLDDITVTAADGPTSEGPGGRAIRTRDVAVVQNVREAPEFGPWREDAIARGYRAVAGVPLVYRDELYGLLGVYADRPNAFDEREQTVLAELGADIAHALHAVELRRELRTSRQKYRALVDTAPDAIFLADPESGEILQANEQAVQLTGRSRDDLVGLHQSDLHPGARDDQYRDLFEGHVDDAPVVRTELPDGSDIHVETVDGERVPVEINASIVDVGDREVVVGIFRDVSERREQARELERQNERLERFARVLSHDLRTPLSVAAGRIELVRERGDDEHLAAAADALERIEDLVDHLRTLMRRGRVVDDPEEASLATLVDRSWTTAGEPSATLTAESNLGRIRGDANRICELLENLFHNAVEHAGPDVAIRVGRLDDGFFVADDGPGIPDSKRETVFEVGVGTGGGGSGWGLNIAHEIATAHGWEVEVAESEAGGARFEFHGVEFV